MRIILIIACCLVSGCGPSALCTVLLTEPKSVIGSPARCPFNKVMTGSLAVDEIECAEITVSCPIK